MMRCKKRQLPSLDSNGEILPAFTRSLPLDARSNVVAYTQFETRWAVDVLTRAASPNDAIKTMVYALRSDSVEWNERFSSTARVTGMDVLWAFYQSLLDRGFLHGDERGFPAAREALQRAAGARNQTREMVAVMSGAADPEAGRDGTEFKRGLDAIWAIMKNQEVALQRPDGKYMTPSSRKKALYDTAEFVGTKGRTVVAEDDSRSHSAINDTAGISQVEYTVAGAGGFYDGFDFKHAKNAFRRLSTTDTVDENTNNAAARFRAAGAPFIAGGSGSMMVFLALMEDTRSSFEGCAHSLPEGLIPRVHADFRQVLAGLLAANLVAAGHHSTTECLLTARRMGYFESIPDPLVDYTAAMTAFVDELSIHELNQSAEDLLLDVGCCQGWQHGVLCVPVLPSYAAAPHAVAKIMQQPYPWGELHFSCTAFTNALPIDEAKRCISVIKTLAGPTVVPVSIDRLPGRRSGASNLVMSLHCPNIGSLLEQFPFPLRQLITQKETSFRATLQYGLFDDVSNITEAQAEAALLEMKAMTWEFAYVARLDRGPPGTGGVPRELIFLSPARGMRGYTVDAKRTQEDPASPRNTPPSACLRE